MSVYNIVAKIHDGTRTLAKGNMCKTCRNSLRVKGDNDSEVINYCHALGARLRFEVADCNAYNPANMPNLNDMYNMAWVVRTDRKTKQIGFQPYKDWKKDNKDEANEDLGFGFGV